MKPWYVFLSRDGHTTVHTFYWFLFLAQTNKKHMKNSFLNEEERLRQTKSAQSRSYRLTKEKEKEINNPVSEYKDLLKKVKQHESLKEGGAQLGTKQTDKG